MHPPYLWLACPDATCCATTYLCPEALFVCDRDVESDPIVPSGGPDRPAGNKGRGGAGGARGNILRPGGEEGQDERGEEDGPALGMCLLLSLSFCTHCLCFPFFYSFLADLGERG